VDAEREAVEAMEIRGEETARVLDEESEDVPAIPETRAVRYRIRETATPGRLAEDVSKLAEHGFNTVIVSVFAQGHAFFPCPSLGKEKMAAIHPAFRRRDPLGEILEIAGEHGLRVLGHVEALHVGLEDAPSRGPILRRRPRWAVRRRPRRKEWEQPDGRRSFLNPANPEARRLLGDILYDLIERYPIEGVYLNDLRYPRGLSSPDQSRRALDLDDFLRSLDGGQRRPSVSFDANSPEFRQWQVWRNDRLNELLRYLHCRLERANAHVWIVSQAVGPYDGEAFRDDLQGDWGTWLSQQYLDGVAPAYRDQSPEIFRKSLEADLAHVPDDRVLYPLLEASDVRGDAGRLEVCRRLPLAGFIFRSFDDFEERDWPLAARAFQRAARPAEYAPYYGAQAAIRECRRLLDRHGDLSEFFGDIARVLPQTPGPRGRVLGSRLARQVVANLRGLERRIAEGDIRLDEDERAVSRWLSLARKCLLLALRY